MITFAGYDWLWWTLFAVLFYASVWVPMFVWGRARSADAYETGWDDNEAGRPSCWPPARARARHAGPCWRCRLHLRWPPWHKHPHCVFGPVLRGGEVPPPLPPSREWAEITADWMSLEARAELTAFVSEMMLKS